ncbi:MAG: hypothetical protein WAM26_02545 [Nitrososphaeraceae archaeon]
MVAKTANDSRRSGICTIIAITRTVFIGKHSSIRQRQLATLVISKEDRV